MQQFFVTTELKETNSYVSCVLRLFSSRIMIITVVSCHTVKMLQLLTNIVLISEHLPLSHFF
jgi:hypothetical protein